jgi:P pilus assembly chaperone PapD
LVLLGAHFAAQANLVIHPIRVQFAPNERSTEVTLLNDSKTTNTYRLEWKEKQAKPEGGYANLTAEAAKQFPVASSMVRFSPRQVTLKPGERQTVKLSVRRPARLADGEYRSHLLFKALPPPVALRDEQVAGLTMQMNLVTSFSIPVVIQQGQAGSSVRLESAQIQYNPTKPNESSIIVNLAHNSRYSVHGDIEAYWTPQGGSEQLIALNNGFTFWPELTKTSSSLIWVGTNFAPTNGKLRILYKGARTYRGQTFVDQSIQLDRGAIKMIN